MSHSSLNKFLTFIVISLILPFSNISADIFKCIDNNGNTFFQDSACSGAKKETKITLQSTRATSTLQNGCIQSCDADSTLCVQALKHGVKGDVKKLSLCKNNKMDCYDVCNDEVIDKNLEELTSQQGYTYDRELRHKRSLEREVRYQEFWQKRDKEREAKRVRRNCHKYQKKLAKVKAQWKRKQQAGWKPKDEEKYRIKLENAEDAVKIECR